MFVGEYPDAASCLVVVTFPSLPVLVASLSA